MVGDWKIHGLDADIDIRCVVALPDGERVAIPVTVRAEHGRFYFEPDQTTVLAGIRRLTADHSLFGFSVIEDGRRVDPRDIRPEPSVIAEAVEDIPEGEPMVIDLGIRLAARPFDAKRDGPR